MSLNSSDLELITVSSGNQKVGIRFDNLEIPQGAQIINAYIEFECDETDTELTSLNITVEDADHAEPFSSDSYDN